MKLCKRVDAVCLLHVHPRKFASRFNGSRHGLALAPPGQRASHTRSPWQALHHCIESLEICHGLVCEQLVTTSMRTTKTMISDEELHNKHNFRPFIPLTYSSFSRPSGRCLRAPRLHPKNQTSKPEQTWHSPNHQASISPIYLQTPRSQTISVRTATG